MEDNKFMDKLENTGELSKVEKDMHSLQNESNKTLINYLITHVTSDKLLGELEQALELGILEKVQDEEEPVSFSAMVAALKVVKESQIQKSNGILGVLKESTKVIIENNVPANNVANKNSDISLKDVTDTKKFIEILNGITDAEFNVEEKIKK